MFDYAKIAEVFFVITSSAVFAYPSLIPFQKRQDRLSKRFHGKKESEYSKENHDRLHEEYMDYVRKDYPNTQEKDRSVVTEEYFIKHHSSVKISNMIGEGLLKEPKAISDKFYVELGLGLALIAGLLILLN